MEYRLGFAINPTNDFDRYAILNICIKLPLLNLMFRLTNPFRPVLARWTYTNPECTLVKLVDAGTPMSVEQYSTEWNNTSHKLDAQGIYLWMQEQLGSPKTVLEIGCGSGLSTCAIAATGARVVAIEFSPSAIRSAQRTLQKQGYSVSIVLLANLSAETVISQADDVLLVEGNALHPQLSKRLPHDFFDAIACWLIGGAPTHVAQSLKRKIKQLASDDMAKYRRLVQRNVFEIGTSALKSTGIVHVTDRGGLAFPVPEEMIGMEYLTGLAEIAKSTCYDFEKSSASAKIIDERALEGKIQYVLEPGLTAQWIGISSAKIVRT